jgi:hypothetical protein
MYCEAYHLPRPDLDRIQRDMAKVWDSAASCLMPADVIAATVRPVTL